MVFHSYPNLWSYLKHTNTTRLVPWHPSEEHSSFQSKHIHLSALLLHPKALVHMLALPIITELYKHEVNYTVWCMVYSSWLSVLHTYSKPIYIHYSSDRFGSRVVETGSTPSLFWRLCISVLVWLGLIDCSKERTLFYTSYSLVHGLFALVNTVNVNLPCSTGQFGSFS
jgi:hypothetical protein